MAVGACGTCATPLRFAPPTGGSIHAGRGGVWRYGDWLPCSYRPALDPGSPVRVIDAPGLADALGVARTWLVDCSRLGTGTFKDLEAQVALSAAADLGVDGLSVFSTGNTARAYHEWARRIDARCRVAIPSTHGEKLQGCIGTSRQPIVAVDGPPVDASSAATAAAAEWSASGLGPWWRLEGPATIAYAVAEHCPDAELVVQTIGSGFGPLGYELGFSRAAAISAFAGAQVLGAHRYLMFQPADAAIVARVWRDPAGVPDVGLLPVDPFEPTLQSTNGPATIAALRQLPIDDIAAVEPAAVRDYRERVEDLLDDSGVTLDFDREKSTFIALTGLLERRLDPTSRLAIVVTGAAPLGMKTV